MRWILLSLMIGLLFSCNKENNGESYVFLKLMELPDGFPIIEEPPTNQFTQARWELGKKLFFDPIMSSDHSISCASCHDPKLSFSDDIAFSLGVEDRIGNRNSPSLANIAYHPYFTREGGVPTIEMQVLVPIQEHNEFDDNIVLIAQRLSKDSSYVRASREAYDRLPDPFVISRALACFERSLISGGSRYDQFKSGQLQFSQAEQNGMGLFFSERTNCSQCHNGFNFTNYSFENNGLYIDYNDPGRYRLTHDDKDKALFKVPSLRNIEVTAPYMHDGSILSLKDIITHYNNGGKNHPHKNKYIKPLYLSEREQADLVAFLLTLTDKSFLNNPIFNK